MNSANERNHKHAVQDGGMQISANHPTDQPQALATFGQGK
jgi:hypothetical protein